jgi:Glycerophosphoryl diester phosphodiesterase family
MKIKLNLLLIICILFSATWQNTIAQTYEKIGYRNSHFCYGKGTETTGYCGLLNNVRKTTTGENPQVIIQAHRGVWGGDVPENTLAAFQAAINQGVKIIEADIMPVDVVDKGNYVNSLSGKPKALVCFHDFALGRLTNGTGFVFEKTLSQLQALQLKKPRSNELSTSKILSFQELLDFAVANNAVVCVDMKNIENKGSSLFVGWTDVDRKRQSLIHNLKFAINGSDINKLKNLAIKTYESYGDLERDLMSGDNPVSREKFDKVLWAPMFAPNAKFETSIENKEYSITKIHNWFKNWFVNNQAVFYYETNIFNRYDKKTSKLVFNEYPVYDRNGKFEGNMNMFDFIYNLTGRRVGIFSEEPVGSRGVVNRWGDWKIKDASSDHRGDHIWLMNIPRMKYGVITTDKPLLWKSINKQ